MSCSASCGEAVKLIQIMSWLIGARGSYGGITIPAGELASCRGGAPSPECRAGALSSLGRAEEGLSQL
jgi:hypothetical protein